MYPVRTLLLPLFFVFQFHPNYELFPNPILFIHYLQLSPFNF